MTVTALDLSVLIRADASGLKAGVAEARSELGGLAGSAQTAGAGLGAGLAAGETAARKAAIAANDVGQSLSDLRAKYSPLYAVQRQYIATLTEIQQAEAAGAFRGTEAAEALERQRAAYANQMAAITGIKAPASAAAAGIAGVGGAAKLTSNQMLNLSRQGNDVVTMFALGASPMQIFASQAGQVVDALQSGPEGLSGSLKAVEAGIEKLFTPMGLIGAGFLAAGAAAVYFATTMRPAIDSASKALDKHEAIVKRLKDSYGEAAKGAGDYLGETRALVDFLASQDRANLKKSYVDSVTQRPLFGFEQRYATVKGLDDAFYDSPLGDEQRVEPKYNAFKTQLEELQKGVKAQNPDLIKFTNDVASTAEHADQATKDLASTLIKAVKDGYDAQRAYEGAAKGAELLADATRRARAETLFADSKSRLQSLVPDNTTDRKRVEDAYRDQLAAINALPGSDKQVDRDGLREVARRDYEKALADIDRKESVIRAGRELDLRAVNAQTVAERAYIAAERERLSLSGQTLDSNPARDKALKDERANAASRQVEAEASRSAADALKASQTARDQAGLTGYAAQLAAINAHYNDTIRLATGSAGAVKDLTAARRLDIEALQQGARRELIQPQEERLRQLAVEASTIGATDDARRRALDAAQAELTLTRQGIEATSELGRAYLQNSRALSDYEDRIRRQSDAWDEVKHAGESAIDAIGAGLSSGKIDFSSILNDVTKSLTELAVTNPLKNALLGTSYGTLGDVGGLGGIVGRLLGQSPETEAPPKLSAGLGALGATSATAMWVRSADGLVPGGGSAGGASGAIERLLSPANSNAKAMDGGSVQAEIANFFAGKGLAPHQIAGILGNVSAESAYNPRAVGDGGNALGLFQWNSRSPALLNAIGGRGNLGDIQGQLEFAWSELLTTEQASLKKLMGSTDVKGATEAFAGFERPRGYSAKNPEGSDNFSGRLSAAESAYAKLGTTSQKLATSASDFTENFGQITGQINAGVGQIADRFVPGLGGVLTKILDAFSAKSGTGGGGIGGFLGSLFGGFGTISSAASAAMDAGWSGFGPAFDSGGYTGAGGRLQPAGLVHRGEVVFSQDDVERHGGVATVEAMRLGLRGYAAGGAVATVLPMSRTMAAAQASPSPNVVVNDYRTSQGAQPVEAKETQDANGTKRLELTIRDIVKDEVTTGGRKTRRTLSTMGVKTPLIGR